MEEIIKSNDYEGDLKKNHILVFVPGGNSMWPTLKNAGQSVIVLENKARLKRFDVALYKRAGGNYVLHRVMKPVDDGYLMCGDSQFAIEHILEEQVVGIMEGFYRGKKYICVRDAEYIKQTEKWYKHKTARKIRLKLFYFRLSLRGKIGRVYRIFVKKKET